MLDFHGDLDYIFPKSEKCPAIVDQEPDLSPHNPNSNSIERTGYEPFAARNIVQLYGRNR